MNISRRSFLKLAALSTAAVAVSASMTGCASVFTPNLSITYQEVDENGKAATNGVTKDLTEKGWKDGKKVISGGDVPGLGIIASKMEFSTSDLANAVADQLKKDGVNLDGKTVKVVTEKDATTIKATKLNASHYTVEVKFKVVAKSGT